jgi:two-component system LytT family response regulator
MNTKLRCLLLDDELPGLAYLRLLCEQLPGVEVVKAYNDPLKFLAEYKMLDFDVCILDIEMPGLNGIAVAQLLQNKPVIFTTAYREYAAEAFDLEAIDYIRKPIMKDRLEKAIDKAIHMLKKKTKKSTYTQLNTNKGKAIVFFDQIVYITTTEMDSRDKLFVLEDGKELIAKNIGFDKLLELLPERDFCRVSKKDIIAIKTIRFFSQDQIQTSVTHPPGKDLLLRLGENYRSAFLEKLKP